LSIFSSADITRFTLQGEEDFAQKCKCISTRLVIPIVAGTSTYTLSDTILSIQQITYKGTRIDPCGQRELRDAQLSGTQSGRPYQYIYNNIGQLKVQLFPVPDENIPDTSTNLYKSPDIETFCILEAWRTPDGSSFVIPSYIRRRLLKAYVMKELYSIEGKGQNLKSAKYWTEMHEKLSEDYKQLLNDLHNKPRNLNHGFDLRQTFKKAPPVLPRGRFGIGVDY